MLPNLSESHLATLKANAKTRETRTKHKSRTAVAKAISAALRDGTDITSIRVEPRKKGKGFKVKVYESLEP